MKAYLAAVSAMALSVGLCACGDFPSPQYPVSRLPDPVEPYAAPPAPAPTTPAPAPAAAPAGTDDAPRALPSGAVQQSTLPPPPAARPSTSKPGAFLDRGLDVGRPGRMLALWRADDAIQVYPAATHHKKHKTETADDQTVTVAKGDTLASIARAHGTSIDDLAKLNRLKSPYRLSAGQTLKLPAATASSTASDEAAAPPAKGKTKGKSASADKPETATVAKGDTLASISRKSGIPVNDLAQLNGLDKPYRLKVGQTLQLKAAEAASDAPAPKTRAGAKPSKAAADSDDQAEGPSTSIITVRRKDTIQSLAKQEHMSVADLARLNHLKKPYRLRPGQQIKLPDQPGAAPRREAAAEETPAGPTVVVAGRRDTLKSIADKHGVPVETLAKLNHLKKPYRIRRGQKIKLPSRPVEERPVQTTANTTSYKVQSGDTLYSLARRFGTDARTLAELNGIDAGDRLTVGRRIRLPGGAEDRIAPKPGRRVASTVEPATPVPYSSLSANPPVAPAPGLTPPPTTLSPPPSAPPASTVQSSSGQSSSSAATPYRPTAPAVEAPAPGDAEVAAAGKGLFLWPVKGDILQRFGPLAGGQRSDGVDIGDASGTPVVAAAGGEVVYAGNSVPSFGNMVLLRHDGGWVTVYAHLASLDVKMRQTVSQGQTIGAVGQTGGVSQPQLHFEVRYAPTAAAKARTIDPMLVLPQ